MKKVMDGCTAVSEIAYKFSEIASIYPITPSSPMASNMDALSSNNTKNLLGGKVDVIEMQSEAGAAGTLHGALMSGTLASTFTSSQGLLLMIPNMYKIAGEQLPAVIHVASRTVATHALSIFGDHSDIYAVRQTGFCMLASSSVQEAHDLSAVAHLSAIHSSLPFLHFMDGFRTSHEINKIDILEDKDLNKLIDQKAIQNFRKKALKIDNPISRGLAENEDIYFQSVIARKTDYQSIYNTVEHYMNKINEIQGTDYKPFNYYGNENAKFIIIAMGSVVSTIKHLVEKLNKEGESVGVLCVHLYRPFNKEALLNALPKSTKRIAVLDRTCEHGSSGEPLYLDILSSLKDTNIEVYGGIYGLSSKNTTPSHIHSVFEMLSNNPKNSFTIGINDDITNTSLSPIASKDKDSQKELVVMGYGSDGCVSACKDLLKIIGNNHENEYVQGYFEYDSKKSGGVTVSHLRVDDNPIDLPYYPEHPNILIITKENYLNKFEVVKNMNKNGVLIVNTKEEFDKLPILTNNLNNLIDKNITIFTIDAELISERNGLKGKISLIFETILLKLLGFDNYTTILTESIKKRFQTKGDAIVNANIKCMKEAILGLVPFKGELKKVEEKTLDKDTIDIINDREGNTLSVKDLEEFKTGIFKGALSKLEKRNTSDKVPVWINENCIQCGMCSLVCPHAVIRPFIIEKDEKLAETGITLIGDKDGLYKYVISVSEADCTGCGLCIEACPGKGGNKALELSNKDFKRQRLANTLFNFYENPSIMDKFTIKGSQFQQPKFEFSGACAGCGETPYIKLLTQLYGDRLVIANATGCSSIYGGSAPSTPYSIPWANSLFEDNAEFGYGLLKGYKNLREKIRNIMLENIDKVNEATKELFESWLENMDNFEITKKIKTELEQEKIPNELKELLSYIETPSVWTIGGDGWAYDIGFSGIDHVLSSKENVNILVLDTEVYSNTGGQASKSSRLGQVAEFTDEGKKTPKKDLFKIAMAYPDVYVASVALGANMFQTIKAFKEAEEHQGPSIIIAYSPCVEQGIKTGMNCSLKETRLAVECGYTILMRYNGETLTIDSKEPNFELYENFLNGEVRYNALKIKNPNLSEELLNMNKNSAIKRYEYYKKLVSKDKN